MYARRQFDAVADKWFTIREHLAINETREEMLRAFRQWWKESKCPAEVYSDAIADFTTE